MKNKNDSIDTQLVNAGRDKAYTGNAINPKIVRASTLVFDSVAAMREAGKHRGDRIEYYGRRGTSTTFAFEQAMCEFEQAQGCFIYPSGTSALTTALLAFLNPGDHLLMVDTAYEPTRDFASGTLRDKGVELSFYDPVNTDALAALIKPNTRVIFMESPGSLTMEVQDIPKIVEMATAHNIITILDNTYATAYNFMPIAAGVDVSVQSATKYICGHSDVMLGVSCANERAWPKLQKTSAQLGLCAGVDDVYTALRGLRTLSIRLRQHSDNALQVAQWLAARSEVDHVRHPALATCPGHAFFKRDFNGGNGLFAFVLNDAQPQAIAAMLDGYRHFKLGFSWGGYESLVLHAHGLQQRQFPTLRNNQAVIRLHIGLESVDDLLEDLNDGFERFNAAS